MANWLLQYAIVISRIVVPVLFCTCSRVSNWFNSECFMIKFQLLGNQIFIKINILFIQLRYFPLSSYNHQLYKMINCIFMYIVHVVLCIFVNTEIKNYPTGCPWSQPPTPSTLNNRVWTFTELKFPFHVLFSFKFTQWPFHPPPPSPSSLNRLLYFMVQLCANFSVLQSFKMRFAFAIWGTRWRNFVTEWNI